MLSSRTFSFWYNYLLPGDNPGKLPETNLLTVYQILDQPLKMYGNAAYTTLGIFELLCLALKLDRLEDVRILCMGERDE
jgi:hypothetical protein